MKGTHDSDLKSPIFSPRLRNPSDLVPPACTNPALILPSIIAMQSWVVATLFFLFGLKYLSCDLRSLLALGELLDSSKQKKNLQKVTSVLQELEDILRAGLLPPQERWKMMEEMAEPWRTLSVESIRQLRISGGSVLPTLKRLKELAHEHYKALEDAGAKSSQAFAQAFTCSMLVPLLGAVLYCLLPEIEKNTGEWSIACFLALLSSSVGTFWLVQMGLSARWGGLKGEHRNWILNSLCMGERFLALVRSGMPPDLAWAKACEPLSNSNESNTLAIAWGHSVWQPSASGFHSEMEKIILAAGTAMKKAVQLSLMEGRPCTERIEAALLSLRQSIRSQVDREVSLLPTRGLKPLFIFVAPALFSLLGFGMWLVAAES